jgi:alkylation response protein AidB-like acyl-CoA dehydrogenase
MNFDLTDEQEMVRDTFARFLDEHSSMARIRKAQETAGFDTQSGMDWPNSAPLRCGFRKLRAAWKWAFSMPRC